MAVDVSEIDSERFTRPRKRPPRVRVDLGWIDPADHPPRRCDVEVDAQCWRSAVGERQSYGGAEGGEQRRRQGPNGDLHHGSALAMTSS
jgi:hypothetical protein